MPTPRRPLCFATSVLGPILGSTLGLGVATGLGLGLGLGLSATAWAAPPMGGTGSGAMPGGQAGPGGPGGPPGGGDSEDGPAEAAPKDKGALAPVVPVPAQPEGRRKVQLFELHGYFRMRADYFHRLDLNLDYDDLDTETNKFFIPPAETAELNDEGDLSSNDASCYQQLSSAGVSATKISQRCARRRGTSSANLRLRLEPTIHVTDTVKVHAQVDLLDNLVLGSTPQGFAAENPWAPVSLFTRSMAAPTQGVNSLTDSITVKRAWGEIRFGFGMTLEAGRMPNHWGMGIFYNDGNGYDRGEHADIVRMVDTDYGDSVDSVKLTFDFGPDKRNALTFGVSYDWASSGPTTAQLLGAEWDSGNLVAQAFSAEKYDDVRQFSIFLERRDDPGMLQRKLSSGLPVVNYGFKSWFRWQTLDRAIGTPGIGDGLGGNATVDSEVDPSGLSHAGVSLGNGGYDDDGDSGLENYAYSLVQRRGWLLTPDLWLRINWRTMRVELEAAGVFGSFRHRDLDEDRTSTDFDEIIETALADELTRVIQFGYALEFKYGLFNDRFHIGVDHGMATGDSSPPTALNYASAFPNDTSSMGTLSDGSPSTLSAFRFNPAYVQDLLLFKELLGTVSNAAYVKPWLAFYFFQNNFSARADIEFAGAYDSRGTLAGDKSIWGLELAGSARYHDVDDPIFIQLQYGVMFPFGGFEPIVTSGSGADATTERLDAKAVQTVQAQLGIRF
ncbi:TIGR04551 family protein [Pseudenhygromyxa sp. WMMC2535]|uniref:TIGR04551 family protein n=1 Tax=Pseudenhygromyxa sp. WMMC2535 TaxID=2712867 RepID=UPI001595E209|nr:TIGR04551 family protein [Pseudenhygromyxa sp. WMMC2535]NVB39175.1 TIGR04551 family protein [Pseudenhygromyxa sp. WMMC2535]NVB43525.1 TIGR04551 family protein [Pseudenhygromyxa sp. WMMC2535]